MIVGLFLIEDTLSYYSGFTDVLHLVNSVWYESPRFHISMGFVIMFTGILLIMLEVRSTLLSGEFP